MIDGLKRKFQLSTRRYQLTNLIGRGSTALVFHGFDSQLGTEIAVKILQEEHQDDLDQLIRLKNEATLSTELTSIHFIRVHNYSFDPPSIVMDFMKGGSLARYNCLFS